MSAYKVVDKYGVGSYLQLESGEGGGALFRRVPLDSHKKTAVSVLAHMATLIIVVSKYSPHDYVDPNSGCRGCKKHSKIKWAGEDLKCCPSSFPTGISSVFVCPERFGNGIAHAGQIGRRWSARR